MKNTSDSLPCKNCVVFAVCKQRYMKGYEEFSCKREPMVGARRSLTDICKLIHDWLFEYTDTSIFSERITVFHNLFNP